MKAHFGEHIKRQQQRAGGNISPNFVAAVFIQADKHAECAGEQD